MFIFLLGTVLAQSPTDYATSLNQEQAFFVASPPYPSIDYYQNRTTPLEFDEGKITPAPNFTAPISSTESGPSASLFPAEFDARIQWPECSQYLQVLDQLNCKSSWAVAAATMISHRTCHALNAAKETWISAQDILTGSTAPLPTCNGGYLYRAVEYYYYNGVATGHPTDQTNGCKPYNPSNLNYSTSCIANYSVFYQDDRKNFGVPLVYLNVDPGWILFDVNWQGVATTQIAVYDSLYYYYSGIYVVPQSELNALPRGLMTLTILGWGTENNVSYWKCLGSWGEDWGEDGTIRIRRGTNEAGIENRIISIVPDVARYYTLHPVLTGVAGTS